MVTSERPVPPRNTQAQPKRIRHSDARRYQYMYWYQFPNRNRNRYISLNLLILFKISKLSKFFIVAFLFSFYHYVMFLLNWHYVLTNDMDFIVVNIQFRDGTKIFIIDSHLLVSIF